MINIEQLIKDNEAAGVVGWTMSDTEISMFVMDVAAAQVLLPEMIDGKTVRIYKSL